MLSFLSPCVLPLVPSYLGFITGMSLDDLRAGSDRKAILVPALAFVAGFTLIFLIMGASATMLGQMFRLYQHLDCTRKRRAHHSVRFAATGCVPHRALPARAAMQLESGPRRALGAGVAGFVFGAGWTPCIGPVLGSLLTLASARASMGNGMLLLAFYSLGLALPFLAAAMATGRFLNTSKGSAAGCRPWKKRRA